MYIAYESETSYHYHSVVMKYESNEWVNLGDFAEHRYSGLSLYIDRQDDLYIAYGDGSAGYCVVVEKYNGTTVTISVNGSTHASATDMIKSFNLKS